MKDFHLILSLVSEGPCTHIVKLHGTFSTSCRFTVSNLDMMQDNEQAECLSNVPNSFLVRWGYYPLAELNRSQNVFIIHTLLEEEGFCLTYVNGTID